MTGPVVPQTEDLRRGLRGALAPGLALVDPVAEVHLIASVSTTPSQLARAICRFRSAVLHWLADTYGVVVLVLAGGISIGVEVAIGCSRGAVCARKSVTRVSTRDTKILTVVAAGEDGEANFGHVVVRRGRRLGAPERAHSVGAADLELIVVCRERLEASCLDLYHIKQTVTSRQQLSSAPPSVVT